MYPYNFKPQETGINHNEIFVAMPFYQEYDDIYFKLIEPATNKANEMLGLSKEMFLKPYRTKEDVRTTSGWINILEHLFTAQIILGVLTSNNANVFYELGIAHATQPITKQILIANKGYERVFDTQDLIYYEYDPDNLALSIDPLASRITDAIKVYKIEEERMIQKTRRLISPYGLEVIMKYGRTRNFHICVDKYRSESEKIAYEKHQRGLENLCQHYLLGLNTKLLKSDDEGIKIEYSYYWTNLGNDVLYTLEIIDKNELERRRKEIPESF